MPGGDSGIRTHDLNNANVALYQLSYVPNHGRRVRMRRSTDELLAHSGQVYQLYYVPYFILPYLNVILKRDKNYKY